MIKYKGYIGHFFFDGNLFRGNVANSHDLITFQGNSVAKAQQAFQDAVDQHIEWCKKYRKKRAQPLPQAKDA